MSIEKSIEKLLTWFKNVEKPVVVAFSGGVDSSVVLAVACRAIECENVFAVTAVSPIRFEEDLEWAKKVAQQLGAKHIILETDELSIPGFATNPPNRCYICKKNLASKLVELAKKLNAKTIVDGSNISDLNSYRPGIQAFREAGIRSPLAELEIRKDVVRAIAKHLGLPNWSKPSNTCIATRIPYGEAITLDKLRRIALAEKIVREITSVEVIRVRDHGYIARIEVDPRERRKFFDEDILDRIVAELKKLGYKYVTLDLQGYRSGSLDELITRSE
ncbi:MAG: ATP-dependent sacrificial sulfur transferase LarE [Ignisphaera sp.]